MLKGKSETIDLFVQFALIGLVTLGLVNLMDSTPESKPSSSGQVRGSTNTEQILEVKPEIGKPVPYGKLIQGSKNSTGQSSAGELQEQSTTNDLQPNAKLPDFPTDVLN